MRDHFISFILIIALSSITYIQIPLPSACAQAKQGDTASQKSSKNNKTEKKNLVQASRSYRKLLKRGRNLVRQKKYKQGIKVFRQALKKDPNNATLLGELGFAALRSGDHQTTLSASLLCVRTARKNKIKGSCYYNLGRAYEQRNDIKRAAQAYRASLEARPNNKIVKKRLASLQIDTAHHTYLPCSGFACTLFKNHNEVCTYLMKKNQEEQGLDDKSMKNSLCNHTKVRTMASTTHSKQNQIIHVYIFKLTFHHMEDFEYLVLQTTQGWLIASLVNYVYNPGAFGIFEESTIHVDVQDRFDHQASKETQQPLLIVRSELNRSDTDLGIAEEETLSMESMQICELRNIQAYCYGPILTNYQYERFHMEGFEEEMKSDPHLVKNKDLPIEIHYQSKVDFLKNGHISIISTKLKVPSYLKKLLGTHAIRSLPKSKFTVYMR